uniref:Uncharacterized protein n=1 Tax=Fagus sylvatica TaxID=28930 RepID=A0A2N9HRK3_FAGSY
MSINCTGSKCSQEDHLALRSQGHERIRVQTGIGKNHVKGEGTKRGNGRNGVNAPMTDIRIVIIGRIGTTEIVTGTRKEKDTGVGIATELVIVIETKVGIVVVTMSVIVIALERGRVKETMMLKTMTMIVGGLVIGNLIMIGLNRNMRGTDMVRGRRTMITLNQRMIVGGMNSLSMGISIQTETKKTLSLMSVVEVGASMIIWMSRTTMTIMNNIMTVVMTNMIEWRMMITNMSMQHRSHVKGREQEMWSMSIKDWSDHSHYLKLVYINDGAVRSFSFLQNSCCSTASSLHLFLWILNELISGIGKNHVKGEGTKRGNRRNGVNAPMTDMRIVIIGRIGTTEIVTRDKERERHRGRDRDRTRDRDRDQGWDCGRDYERDRDRTRERESERDYDVEDHDHDRGRLSMGISIQTEDQEDPEPYERCRSRGQYDHLDVQDDHDHYEQYHDRGHDQYDRMEDDDYQYEHATSESRERERTRDVEHEYQGLE